MRILSLKYKALAIVGPTASGKSDIALKIAKKYNGEIVSCDSRQIYRYMDIGTGKVLPDQRFIAGSPQKKPEEKNRDIKKGKPTPVSKSTIQNPDKFFCENIRHHMIDIVSPNTPYNVAKFKKRADRIIQDILSRGKLPILCGGTGLWAQAVVENMSFPEVPPDTQLRNRLLDIPTKKLFTLLKKLNPQRAKIIDSKNRHRLIRAIEIASNPPNNRMYKRYRTSTLKSQSPTSLSLPPITWTILAVNPPREILFAKIETRLDARLKEGLIDEVGQLHYKKKVPWTRLDSFGLEYRWISRYLRGLISHDEARKKLLTDIRHYAKRQLTWLRRWEKMGKKIHWVTSLKEAKEVAKTFLK